MSVCKFHEYGVMKTLTSFSQQVLLDGVGKSRCDML